MEYPRLKKLLSMIRRATCRHEFELNDLERTGVTEPARPDFSNRDAKTWEAYLHELWHGDWRKHVVRWPCCKCGRVFEAFCGLDILKHGRIVKRRK